MKTFTAAGLLLLALLSGATDKPSPPPGQPLPGPPAILEPVSPPSSLPALSPLAEPSGRTVAPSSTGATPAQPPPSVNNTSSPSVGPSTGPLGSGGESGAGWIAVVLAGLAVAAISVVFWRRSRHAR